MKLFNRIKKCGYRYQVAMWDDAELTVTPFFLFCILICYYRYICHSIWISDVMFLSTQETLKNVISFYFCNCKIRFCYSIQKYSKWITECSNEYADADKIWQRNEFMKIFKTLFIEYFVLKCFVFYTL